MRSMLVFIVALLLISQAQADTLVVEVTNKSSSKITGSLEVGHLVKCNKRLIIEPNKTGSTTVDSWQCKKDKFVLTIHDGTHNYTYNYKPSFSNTSKMTCKLTFTGKGSTRAHPMCKSG